jgi:hypothetical protein
MSEVERLLNGFSLGSIGYHLVVFVLMSLTTFVLTGWSRAKAVAAIVPTIISLNIRNINYYI